MFFQSSSEILDVHVSSIADLVLKDKIVVYDLGHQRVGWAKYNCTFNILFVVFIPPGDFKSTKFVSCL